MSTALRWAVIPIGAYLLGNFQSGIIISSLFGKIDIRRFGSGNAGTSNVTRILGVLPGILTLILDVGKGALAAWIGKMLLGDMGMIAAGAMVVIGHNWPALFMFKGGRGIAASLGVLVVVEPVVALVLFAAALIIIAITGFVSVASLAGFTAGLGYFFVTEWGNWPLLAFWLAMWIMAVYSHRENIKRLIAGKENKLLPGARKPVADKGKVR